MKIANLRPALNIMTKSSLVFSYGQNTVLGYRPYSATSGLKTQFSLLTDTKQWNNIPTFKYLYEYVISKTFGHIIGLYSVQVYCAYMGAS